MTVRALVIEDDAVCRRGLVAALERLGLSVYQAGSVEEGRPLLEEGMAMLFLDLGLPGMSGDRFVSHLARHQPEIPVVIVTADDRLERAVELMRRGAFDYLAKPVTDMQLEAVVHRAHNEWERRREVKVLREERDRRHGLKAVVGSSPPMRKVFEQIRQASRSTINVVLLGESGTGKEMLARALHHESPRRDGPFVTLNCAAAPTDLLEPLLFGHRQGAFPGAVENQRGRVLMADAGTLFLDEIGEMPPELQAKLLRTLQDRTILPMGAEEEIPVDVRIVAATNRDIEQQLADGRFRQDLFYRLVAFPIAVPALRERPGDVPELAYHFLHKHRGEAGRSEIARIAEDALELLQHHPWPGNVRQLENAIYHALLTARPGTRIACADLPEAVRHPERGAAGMQRQAEASQPTSSGGRKLSILHDPTTGQLLPLRQIEELAFAMALEESGGNTTRAAKTLGVARATLYRRLKNKKSA
ncbi:MAG: sigma-54 dependent transcriptional regulator [Planctomycetota bacterium]|nr:sigma-54 dependent transcriptional regulator [Planctomycetota bacterium]